jgi:hypothetical protein
MNSSEEWGEDRYSMSFRTTVETLMQSGAQCSQRARERGEAYTAWILIEECTDPQLVECKGRLRVEPLRKVCITLGCGQVEVEVMKAAGLHTRRVNVFSYGP